MAIIVSEETGSISLAVNGRLEGNLDIGKIKTEVNKSIHKR